MHIFKLKITALQTFFLPFRNITIVRIINFNSNQQQKIIENKTLGKEKNKKQLKVELTFFYIIYIKSNVC
jgi:hypothetical protein